MNHETMQARQWKFQGVCISCIAASKARNHGSDFRLAMGVRFLAVHSRTSKVDTSNGTRQPTAARRIGIDSQEQQATEESSKKPRRKSPRLFFSRRPGKVTPARHETSSCLPHIPETPLSG